MIERYTVLASRIRQELSDLARVVARVERAIGAIQQRPEDQDLYFDSVALNLHDFYTGLERLLEQIASGIDRNVPTGSHWHQELLRQMATDIPQIRPQVLSRETTQAVNEYLRFRHVVRNIYAFEFDPERLQRLATGLRPTLVQVQAELQAFADLLDQLAQAG